MICAESSWVVGTNTGALKSSLASDATAGKLIAAPVARIRAGNEDESYGSNVKPNPDGGAPNELIAGVPVRWPGPGELLVTNELFPRARPAAAPSAPVDVIRAHRTRKEST